MTDEPDLDQPGRPKIIISESGEEVEVEQTLRDNILSLWEGLGSPEPPDISREALISDGIPYDAYEVWRLEIEDVKRRDAEILADAAAATARDDDLRAQEMEPIPPRRSQEEIAAVDQRQQEMEESPAAKRAPGRGGMATRGRRREERRRVAVFAPRTMAGVLQPCRKNDRTPVVRSALACRNAPGAI